MKFGIGGGSVFSLFGIQQLSGGTPPSAPTATAATNVTDVSFSVNWVAVTGATGYFVYLYASDGTTLISKTDVGNVVTYSVTGRTANINYKTQVSAYNAGGEGALSSPQTSVTTYITEAQAFIAANVAAGGTLTANNKLAINNIFKNFKGVGISNSTSNIYSRIYPYLFVGGTANSANLNARTLASGTFGGSNLGYANNAFHTNTNAYFETVEYADDLTANRYGYLVFNRNSLSGTVNDIFGTVDHSLFSISINTFIRHLASSAGGSIDEYNTTSGAFGYSKKSGNLSFFLQDNTLVTFGDPPCTAVTLTHSKFRLGFIGVVSNAGTNIYSPLIITNGLSDVEVQLLQLSMEQYNTEILL